MRNLAPCLHPHPLLPHETLQHLLREVDIRLHKKKNSNSRDARPVNQNHLGDKVDLDQ